MTTIWAHLPNATFIDRILASMKVNIDAWDAAWITLPKLQSRAVGQAAWMSARQAVAREPARAVAWNAARDAVWYATTGAGGRTAAQYTARHAILALVAYDDCAYMLDSDPGELAILAKFGNDRAILLLSACKAFHSISIIA